MEDDRASEYDPGRDDEAHPAPPGSEHDRRRVPAIEAAGRVRAFLDSRAAMLGIDHDEVMALHGGTERLPLLTDDLKVLVTQAEEDDDQAVARFLIHAKVELAHPKPGDLVVINGPAEVSPELAEAIAEEMGLLCEQYGLGPSGWILLTAGLSLEVLTPDALLAAGLVRVPVESNAGRAEGVSVPRGTVAGHAASSPLVEDVKP